MIPPQQLLAIAALRAQGYLTLREIAGLWGEGYANVKALRARGKLAGALRGPDGRTWFVPAEAPRPAPQHRCGRSRAAKRAAAYQSVVRPPPVSLAPKWARWAAFCQPQAVMDLGWLGGWTAALPPRRREFRIQNSEFRIPKERLLLTFQPDTPAAPAP